MSQPQQSPHHDFIMAFLVCFIVGGLCWVIWYFFHLELTNFVRYVRVMELELIKLIYGEQLMVRADGIPQPQSANTWRQWLWNVRVEDIRGVDIKVATQVTQKPLRYFFVGFLAFFALVVMFRGPGTQFRRRMGLEALMKEQAKAFPVISPFLKFDPRKLPFRAPGQPVPAQLPMFSEALAPEEWLAYNEVRMTGGRLDANACYRGLARQLGNRWQGPQKLPLHMQGLYAVFALRHVRKRKDSEDMLAELAQSWSADGGFRPSGKLVSRIRSVIKDPKLGGALQKFANQHAYETTALLRCLSRAREEGGVIAPAQFLWLRGFDRTLWYPLNNLGRKSYHAEAAGAMVHYTNELIAGQKIPTPRFDEVIRGIESYMKSGMARTIPELDKKSGKGKKS